MKAVTIDRFGGREVLKLTDQPVPELNHKDLLIRVKAAGVNPVDWKIRQGLLQERLPHQFPMILGWDVSGVVAKTGKNVTRFQVGDPIMAYVRKNVVHEGTYAEFVSVPEDFAANKPGSL